LELESAQDLIIEFATAEDGHYPIVKHFILLVEASGVIKAGDGDPKN
jgi:hypothetical protein